MTKFEKYEKLIDEYNSTDYHKFKTSNITQLRELMEICEDTDRELPDFFNIDLMLTLKELEKILKDYDIHIEESTS